MLCDAVAQLQLRRRFAPGRLTRSAQLDLLRDGALEALGEAPVPGCVARAAAARRGADYFSSQLRLTRRLGDVAEMLRHLELEERGAALREELRKVKASGQVLGEDSLNRLQPRDGGLRRTVRIPVDERQVFLSKERTPVLLLAETLAVGNDGNAEGGEGEEEESNGGRKWCNSGVISSPSAQGNEMSALGSLIRRSSRDYGYESLSVPAPRATTDQSRRRTASSAGTSSLPSWRVG